MSDAEQNHATREELTKTRCGSSGDRARNAANAILARFDVTPKESV